MTRSPPCLVPACPQCLLLLTAFPHALVSATGRLLSVCQQGLLIPVVLGCGRARGVACRHARGCSLGLSVHTSVAGRERRPRPSSSSTRSTAWRACGARAAPAARRPPATACSPSCSPRWTACRRVAPALTPHRLGAHSHNWRLPWTALRDNFLAAIITKLLFVQAGLFAEQAAVLQTLPGSAHRSTMLICIFKRIMYMFLSQLLGGA